MKITDEQKKKEQQVFMAVWEFYKKYYNPEENHEYWENVVSEGGKIGEQIGRLGKNFILNVIEELTTKSREMRKESRKENQ